MPSFANSTWLALGVISGSTLLAVVFLRSRWRQPCAWFALALAGYASALQLIHAGNRVKLQFFHPWDVLIHSNRRFFLSLVLLQALLVFWATRKDWPRIRHTLLQVFSLPRAFVFLALAGFAAETIRPEVAQALVAGSGFWGELANHCRMVALALFIYAVNGLNLLLVTRSIPDDLANGLTAWWSGLPRARLPWICAIWVVLAASTLHWVALDGVPHIPDETAYLFHAKTLADGQLWLSPPPDPEAINVRFSLIDGDRWYVTPPVGWPAVLAIGVWFGVPWLVNPLLGGIAVLLAHALIRNLYDRQLADGTALLLASSPWLLFTSSSLLTHPLTLVLALVCLLGVYHARTSGRIAWAGAAGLAAGAMLHVRPLDAVALAGAAGLWWLWTGWKRLRWSALSATLATGVAMSLLFLAYNQALTGDPFLPPLEKYVNQTVYENANRLGFGPNVGSLGWTGLDALPGHGPIDVVMNTNQNLYMVQFDLFGWGFGSLAFVFLLLVRGRWREHSLLWLVTGTIITALSFYWFSGGPDFGARYWYLTLVPVAALSAAGVRFLAERLAESGLAGWQARRLYFAVTLACCIAVPNLVSWRIFDKYTHYRGMRGDVRRLAKEHKFGRSLVFIRGRAWPDYASAFVLNEPDFSPSYPGTIYAHEVSLDSSRELRRFYSDRPVWILEGPSVTGDAYRVVAGPLLPGQDLGDLDKPNEAGSAPKRK